ncbi:hypothetical protein D3C87_1968780 [compost metagenome]
MPLPDIAVERSLGVDLELMHVHLAVQQLPRRIDQAWMAGHSGEYFIEGMSGEHGAHHTAFFLDHFVAVHLVQRWKTGFHQCGFLL